MQLTLIRHTKVNVPKGICYGQSDVALANSFEGEAEHIKHSVDLKFDAIYSSPLSRCTKLSDYLFGKQAYQTDYRLKELNFGKWEGENWDTVYKEQKNWFDNYLDMPCPNGESYNNLLIRIKGFLTEIKTKHENQRVCIVTHGGPIKVFLSLIQGVSVKESFSHIVGFGEILTFE